MSTDVKYITVEEFLEHHGVKGQKWGVRKDKGHEGERAKTKKIAKLDKKFDRNADTFPTMVKIHNRAAQLANTHDLDRINNKPEYKNQDFTRNSPLREKYYKEHQDAFLDRLTQAATEMGTNASGTKRLRISEGMDGSWNVFSDSVAHADEELPVFSVDIKYDPRGYIMEIMMPDLQQDNMDVLSFLEHHGVKGQRWGVRRKSKASHPNAKTTFGKQPKRLSDEELNKRIKRMELEKRYSDLNSSASKTHGKKYAEEILSNSGKAVVGTVVGTTVAFFLKRALTSAFA